MVVLKRGRGQENCPKCGGSVYLDSDEHGWFMHCLQCGHTKDLEVIVNNVREQAATGRRGSRR
ncbi:MAG: hypothetical protein PHR56_00955 [Dehalococcoidales bacterium]|nr:hypothetical protein [Dehalococcoidales bacterium]